MLTVLRCPLQLGHKVCLVKSSVSSSVQHLKPIACQLHPLDTVPPSSRLTTNGSVGLLVPKTPRFHSHPSSEMLIRDGCRHQVQRTSRSLWAKGNLTSTLADFDTFHACHGWEIIGRGCGIWRWSHQNAILHQRDPRGTLGPRSPHAHIWSKAKPIFFHQIQACQRMQGLHGVRIRHFRQHLGREPLHRARDFAWVKGPSSQP